MIGIVGIAIAAGGCLASDDEPTRETAAVATVCPEAPRLAGT
jgi:hypothetical protein